MIVEDLLYCHLLTGVRTMVNISDPFKDDEAPEEFRYYRKPISGFYQDPEIEKYSNREVHRFTYYPYRDTLWIWLSKK